jgi:hypothetical protein
VVPARHDDKDGKSSASTQAVNAGAAGNIPAHALDGICCNNGVAISNPTAFSGGTDSHVVHIVTQADVDNAKIPLTTKLESQVVQQLQKRLGNGEVMAGAPTYTVTVSQSNPVGAPVDQIQVSVTLLGTAVVYNRDVVSHLAAQLLRKQTEKMPNSPYQLQAPPAIDTPRVIQQAKDGLIYLRVSVHGLLVYPLSPEQLYQWRQSIKNKTSASALEYLTQQDGIGAVQLHLPPGTDHLPSSIDDIEIVLLNVA